MAGETTTIEAGADGGEGAALEQPQEGGQDGASQPQQGKPAPAKRKFSYKVDGKPVEEELSEEELVQRLSHGRAASRRMAEAARERKELATEREKLAQEREALTAAQKAIAGDPKALRKFLREQVGDPEKAHRLLVKAMREEIDELNLDPRDRELAELRAERQAREAAEAEAKEVSEKEAHAAQVKEAVEKHKPVFIQRLGKIMDLQGVPKNDAGLALAANIYMENVREGLGLNEAEIAEAVRDESQRVVAGFTDGWTGDDWEKNHPAAYKACVAHAAARIRNRQKGAEGETNRQGPQVKSQPGGARSPDGRIPPKKPLSRAEEKAIFGD